MPIWICPDERLFIISCHSVENIRFYMCLHICWFCDIKAGIGVFRIAAWILLKGNGPQPCDFMIRHIIFDMDGTLFDTELLTIQCWERAAQTYGIPNVAAVCRECIGKNAEETQRVFDHYYGDRFPILEIRHEVVAELRRILAVEGPSLKPYAEELLRYLKSEGYHMAVASGTVTDLVRSELAAAGFLSYFDCVVGGDMAPCGKPAPDIFLLACEKMGCSPEDTMIVEDSFSGIRAAHTAGAVTLMVPDLIPPTPEICSLCDGVFDDLSGVQEFIKTYDKSTK